MYTPLPNAIKVIMSADEIDARISKLAQRIDNDYKDSKQLLILGILRGSFIFVADLTRKIQTQHVVDFMALTSYNKNISSGEVRILMDSRAPIKGQDVLIVEDILDSGETLKQLYSIISERQPKSLRTCLLVRKERKQVNIEIDTEYIVFDKAPDVWIVGYGLDYDNRYRTLPFIAELNPDSM